MSETCVVPLHRGVGGLHGRKGNYRRRLARPPRRGCTCVPCFFLCTAGTKGNRSFQTPSTMLRPKTYPEIYNTLLYTIDTKSVREDCVPSSTAYETPQQKLYKRQADKDWYRLPPLHTAVQRSSATGDDGSSVASNDTRRLGKHPPDR